MVEISRIVAIQDDLDPLINGLGSMYESNARPSSFF